MKFEQKITKIGNSLGLILPKALLEKLNVNVGETIYLEQVNDKVILEKYPSNPISPE